MSLCHKVGKNIRRLRNENGYRKIEDLAAIARVPHLNKIEIGISNAKLGTLQNISGALGVPLSTFFIDCEADRQLLIRFVCHRLGKNIAQTLLDTYDPLLLINIFDSQTFRDVTIHDVELEGRELLDL